MTVSAPVAPQEHTFETPSGQTLAYSLAGSGPIIVAQTPGWGIGPSYVRAAWAPLQKTNTVITFCPRGTAPSSRPFSDDEMSSGAMANDLESLRIHLGLEQLDLVGTSNAGCIALYYAARYPTRVRRLIVVGLELIGFSDKDASERVEIARAKDAAFVKALNTRRTVKPTTDAELDRFVRAILPVYVFHAERDAPKFAADLSGGMSAWCRSTQAAADDKAAKPQLSEVASIQAKTLIIHGEMDYVCPISGAIKVEEAVQNSKLVSFPECSHFPWLERTEEYWAEVTAFLAE